MVQTYLHQNYWKASSRLTARPTSARLSPPTTKRAPTSWRTCQEAAPYGGPSGRRRWISSGDLADGDSTCQSLVQAAAYELRARMDLQFPVDTRQVDLDRLRAEEQTSGSIPIGQSFRDEKRDLELLRSQPLCRGGVVPPKASTRGVELDSRSFGPRSSPDPPERLESGLELRSGGAPLSDPTEALAVEELGSGPLERARLVVVQLECRPESLINPSIRGEESTTTGRCRESPRTLGQTGLMLEPLEVGRGELDLTDPCQRLDQIALDAQVVRMSNRTSDGCDRRV